MKQAPKSWVESFVPKAQPKQPLKLPNRKKGQRTLLEVTHSNGVSEFRLSCDHVIRKKTRGLHSHKGRSARPGDQILCVVCNPKNPTLNPSLPKVEE